jgi:hypothetical protein
MEEIQSLTLSDIKEMISEQLPDAFKEKKVTKTKTVAKKKK